jgi:8-oxo-dGTP diphosphatase
MIDMRVHIRNELKGIAPLDATESEHLADALAWVDSGVELCRIIKPATPPKHLVSDLESHALMAAEIMPHFA